jgi:hypothetical protein
MAKSVTANDLYLGGGGGMTTYNQLVCPEPFLKTDSNTKNKIPHLITFIISVKTYIQVFFINCFKCLLELRCFGAYTFESFQWTELCTPGQDEDMRVVTGVVLVRDPMHETTPRRHLLYSYTQGTTNFDTNRINIILLKNERSLSCPLPSVGFNDLTDVQYR